jgi:hypothetical protein
MDAPWAQEKKRFEEIHRSTKPTVVPLWRQHCTTGSRKVH